MTTQTVVPRQLFLPELMMQRGELAKARRLLRKLDRIQEQSCLDEVLPKPVRRGCDHFLELRKAVWVEMDLLAAEVWKREAGLERYSVIHVQRQNMEFRIQVLEFSFTDDFGLNGQWAWNLQGRLLRKDGTLGLTDGRAVFRIAHIRRRHLDGLWREMRGLGEEKR